MDARERILPDGRANETVVIAFCLYKVVFMFSYRAA